MCVVVEPTACRKRRSASIPSLRAFKRWSNHGHHGDERRCRNFFEHAHHLPADNPINDSTPCAHRLAPPCRSTSAEYKSLPTTASRVAQQSSSHPNRRIPRSACIHPWIRASSIPIRSNKCRHRKFECFRRCIQCCSCRNCNCYTYASLRPFRTRPFCLAIPLDNRVPRDASRTKRRLQMHPRENPSKPCWCNPSPRNRTQKTACPISARPPS